MHWGLTGYQNKGDIMFRSRTINRRISNHAVFGLFRSSSCSVQSVKYGQYIKVGWQVRGELTAIYSLIGHATNNPPHLVPMNLFVVQLPGSGHDRSTIVA